MIENGYFTIVIYNRSRMVIPMLGRRDEKIVMSVGVGLYRTLKGIPGIQVYTLEEDNKRLAESRVQQYQAAPEVKSQPVVSEKVVVSDTVSVVKPATVEYSEEDSLIEKKLNELPEDEEESIVLNEADFEEIAERASIKKYEKSVLSTMTKAQLKNILNVERGFAPGHKYYGGYHDTQPTLVGYVLNSQK
jgi:hypothetical protein